MPDWYIDGVLLEHSYVSGLDESIRHQYSYVNQIDLKYIEYNLARYLKVSDNLHRIFLFG